MNIGLKAVLALTFLGASLPAQETPVLESEVDKVNYGIGVGVANGQMAVSSKELVEAADDNLYRAKREGRNRVCF